MMSITHAYQTGMEPALSGTALEVIGQLEAEFGQLRVAPHIRTLLVRGRVMADSLMWVYTSREYASFHSDTVYPIILPANSVIIGYDNYGRILVWIDAPVSLLENTYFEFVDMDRLLSLVTEKRSVEDCLIEEAIDRAPANIRQSNPVGQVAKAGIGCRLIVTVTSGRAVA